MLFLTISILKSAKTINHDEYCYHVKQFILVSANSYCNFHILFIYYVLYFHYELPHCTLYIFPSLLLIDFPCFHASMFPCFHVSMFPCFHRCWYRKRFNTQAALLSLIEKWKSILDKKRLLWGSADGPFKTL